MDRRKITTKLCDGRELVVKPDVIGDFREIPFEDESFRLVVFDPPHLVHIGENSWMCKKYGKLDPETWGDDLHAGFCECFRVLVHGGFLVFKWNETQIPVEKVVSLSPYAPLFGNRCGKNGNTHWIVFVKDEPEPDLFHQPITQTQKEP
jgi:ubiquinone/menaquinone biosynthesis C-methylase UbiE